MCRSCDYTENIAKSALHACSASIQPSSTIRITSTGPGATLGCELILRHVVSDSTPRMRVAGQRSVVTMMQRVESNNLYLFRTHHKPNIMPVATVTTSAGK